MSTPKKRPAPAIRKTVPGPALPPPSSPPAVNAGKRSRKPSVMKQPIERAEKLIRLLDAKSQASRMLISNWQAPMTAEQQKVNGELVALLHQIAPLAEKALMAIGLLISSGFAPTATRGSRGPLRAGARVMIKDKRFNTALGNINDFEVVLEIEGMVRLREVDNPRGPQPVVPRGWIVVLDSGDSGDDTELEMDLEPDFPIS